MTYFSEKNMTYAAAHPGTLPLGDSELQAKMKRKFSVTADSTHVRVACSYTCGETGDEVLGIDPSEVYECNEFAEEDIRDVEHIYLMYHVAQDSDTMEVTYAAGVNPKLVFVCQNIADVNSIRPDYKMTVLPQGCPMPSVASNLGNKSYPDDPAAVTNKGAVYQDSFKLPAGSVAPLVASSGGVRKVDLTVCVYKNYGQHVERRVAMKGNRFKQDNRGASLLAVLVLMVVVSLIAVVITKITIVNIEMKEVERGTKKNFYSADELMDNLRAGARELAEQSLEKAYADVLENYLTYSASGGDVQKVFATRYMDGLQKQFAENHTDPAVGASDTMDASGNVAYRVSGYDTDTVKSCIKEAADQGCYIPATDPKYEVDYGAGTFTLKGVQIRYKDAQDYETTIKTDLVFSTPKMNFSGRGQVQEFMRYALIADRQINIGAQNVTVDGNVYAGADGIYGQKI